MSGSRCKSCDAAILWAVSAVTGKRMPLDADPVPDGNLLLDAEGKIHVLTADAATVPGVKRYVSHFATCPQADDWRKDR